MARRHLMILYQTQIIPFSLHKFQFSPLALENCEFFSSRKSIFHQTENESKSVIENDDAHGMELIDLANRINHKSQEKS